MNDKKEIPLGGLTKKKKNLITVFDSCFPVLSKKKRGVF